MPVQKNPYALQNGFIHNWLTAGPVAEAVEQAPASFADWVRENYSSDPQIEGQPVEQGPLTEGLFTAAGQQGAWKYYRCREDHWVDHSASYPTRQYLRSWAYTELVSPAPQSAAFVLTTFGPTDVWVNGENICCVQQAAGQPVSVPFSANLSEGENTLMVRFVGLAAPQCRLAAALRVEAEGLSLQIPTLIPSLERRNELESVNEKVYLDRDVYPTDQKIQLCWPAGPEKSTYQDVQLQSQKGRIYSQVEDIGKPDSKQALINSAALNEGPYKAFILPRLWEYYDSQIRITHELECWAMGRNNFSEKPYGALEERRNEALLFAAVRENHLYAEIAKAALGRWGRLDTRVITQVIAGINQRQEGSEIQLIGLLGLMYRFSKHPELPRPVRKQIRECLLNFRYWKDEPGDDVMRFDLESRQIIFHACEILAGQLYPSQVFGNSGMTGRQHRRKGEALALSWMQLRSHSGFQDWDSREGYAQVLVALSHLVDLAKTEAIWELGSVLMDKLFFSIAVNSYKGVFGSSQGRASSATLKSGMLDPLSGITRVMWGMGVLNSHIEGSVSLACLSNYELPPIFTEIAAGQPVEMWSKEQQAVGPAVNKVTYRTPDYILSSVQDYRPGEAGEREHIWQATLGAQNVVFVTHPGCASENDAHAPNFWLGNATLPRVAQWKDALIALYQLPEDAWLPYTHAYFPTFEFDEYVLRERTAFACKGEGYIALTAAQGLELVEEGRTAYRELRSYGKHNIWLCQMGRAKAEGDFKAFQESVLARRVILDDLDIEYQTLQGDILSFGWNKSFQCNGVEQPLSGFKHYENPFSTAELPCTEMEIRTADYLLRLHFGEM
jgi:hypothetical protein